MFLHGEAVRLGALRRKGNERDIDDGPGPCPGQCNLQCRRCENRRGILVPGRDPQVHKGRKGKVARTMSYDLSAELREMERAFSWLEKHWHRPLRPVSHTPKTRGAGA